MGDTKTLFGGVGDVELIRVTPDGDRVPMLIRNARYSEGFHVNLVSYSVLEGLGFQWQPSTGMIIRGQQPVVRTARCHGMYVLELESQSSTPFALATKLSARPAVSKASPER